MSDINIMDNIHKNSVGKNPILNANLMRGSKIYNNKFLNLLHQTPIKLNNFLNYLNPNFYIQKVTKKLLAPIEKRIIAIKQKVISKITDKTKKYYLNLKLRLLKRDNYYLLLMVLIFFSSKNCTFISCGRKLL